MKTYCFNRSVDFLHASRSSQCVLIAVSFLVAQVGLCVLVVAYVVGGAFLFKHIEGDAETLNKQQIRSHRQACLQDMFNITEQLNVFERVRWIKSVEIRLKRYFIFLR